MLQLNIQKINLNGLLAALCALDYIGACVKLCACRTWRAGFGAWGLGTEQWID